VLGKKLAQVQGEAGAAAVGSSASSSHI